MKEMMISVLGIFVLCMAFNSACGFPKNLSTSRFDDAFHRLFGNDHVILLDQEGKSVQISLDQYTGSGFISQNPYHYAYFSSSIKLPSNYTAGVVVTFYASNVDVYKNSHDEIDFEFLGHIEGRPWVIQTNIYGNGSTSRGREERYNLWFDPTLDYHNYSFIWTQNFIVFYVDGVPIRETKRVSAMGGDFPSKPMSLYATIWDGSDWATDGGKHKIDLKYAPFIAKYSDFVLYGCSVGPARNPQICDESRGLSPKERTTMKQFRLKYMTFSYCHDPKRYPTRLPECVVDLQEAGRL